MVHCRSEANIGFQDHVLLDHLISDLPKKGRNNCNQSTKTHVYHVHVRASAEVYATSGEWFIKESTLHCGGKTRAYTMVQGHLQHNVR